LSPAGATSDGRLNRIDSQITFMTPRRATGQRDRVAGGAATLSPIRQLRPFQPLRPPRHARCPFTGELVKPGGHMVLLGVAALGLVMFGYLKVRRNRKAAEAR
jgi:hypothetical protein